MIYEIQARDNSYSFLSQQKHSRFFQRMCHPMSITICNSEFYKACCVSVFASNHEVPKENQAMEVLT